MANEQAKGAPSVLDRIGAEAVAICGDDPHREGVPGRIVALLQEAFQDEAVCDEALALVARGTDLYGTNADPGFGIMGVESSRIGYREPHDHGPCWAINVQVRGQLRMVHWAREAVDEASGRVTLRKLDEVLLGPGDVDYSPPGVAHELYPESDDSVELAIRCHSLASIIQNRYDRASGKMVQWSWAKKAVVGEGTFDILGGDQEPPPPSALTARVG